MRQAARDERGLPPVTLAAVHMTPLERVYHYGQGCDKSDRYKVKSKAPNLRRRCAVPDCTRPTSKKCRTCLLGVCSDCAQVGGVRALVENHSTCTPMEELNDNDLGDFYFNLIEAAIDVVENAYSVFQEELLGAQEQRHNYERNTRSERAQMRQ